MKRSTLPALLLFFALTLPAAAQQEIIRFESTAEVELAKVTPQGEKVLERRPATLVVPGTVVIYTNRYTNQGSEAAEGLVITNPLPENMAYLDGSAFDEGTVVVFSVDGGQSFDRPEDLTVTDTDGSRRPAQAEDYTHIRWKVLAPLSPGATGEVEYRAKLK